MNINAGTTPLVLLCPAWKRWGAGTTVKPGTVILHSQGEDVVPFSDSVELVRNSGLDESALVIVGSDHRLAEPEPLAAMAKACERTTEGGLWASPSIRHTAKRIAWSRPPAKSRPRRRRRGGVPRVRSASRRPRRRRSWRSCG
jgi:hypothetical protein